MPNTEQLMEILPDCTGYLAGVEKISAELLNKSPNLRVISRNGIGIDNVDKKTAEKMGISLKTTPGANSRGVAELTIGLIFSLVRSIPNESLGNKNDVCYSSMDKLLRGSDIVTLHCPGGDTPLIDETAITQMKQKSYQCFSAQTRGNHRLNKPLASQVKDIVSYNRR